MEMIDRKALGVGRCNPALMLDRAYAAGWNGVVNLIEKSPTIDPVHAAGACYCKECKHSERSGNLRFCYHWEYQPDTYPNEVQDDDFCSYGERKAE